MLAVPVVRNIASGAEPDPVVAARIVEELDQSDRSARPRDQPVVQRHAHDLRPFRSLFTLTRMFVSTTDVGAERQVCWMAESSQLPPRARMKVHNSVTSLRSPPSTMRLLARSTMLSLSANFIATVA